MVEEEGGEADGTMEVVLVGGEEGVSRGGREVEGIIDMNFGSTSNETKRMTFQSAFEWNA